MATARLGRCSPRALTYSPRVGRGPHILGLNAGMLKPKIASLCTQARAGRARAHRPMAKKPRPGGAGAKVPARKRAAKLAAPAVARWRSAEMGASMMCRREVAVRGRSLEIE